MENKFRIKGALVKDRPVFYPEVCKPYCKKKGILWWKKDIVVEEWMSIVVDQKIPTLVRAQDIGFNDYRNILSFDSLEVATQWLSEFKIVFNKKENEKSDNLNKYLGALNPGQRIYEI